MLRTILSMLIAFFALASRGLASNLVINGDFSAGNTGFTSGYSYVAPTVNSLVPEGVYTIAADPHSPVDLNEFGTADYYDHTVGTANGDFMIVNGATTANTIIWQQTVSNLQTNTTYYFSAWFSSWGSQPGIPALLQFGVNGNPDGASFTAPTTDGVWADDEQSFNTGAATSATLQLINLQIAAGGNDFGMDDVRLDVTPVPEPGVLTVIASCGMLAVYCRRPRTCYSLAL